MGESRATAEAGDRHTGNRALMLEEPLIFEIGDTADAPALIWSRRRC
jgi:hypothetical protein